MFGKKKQTDQMSRYVDPTGEFTNKELNAGLWYVRHKMALARAGTIVLAGIALSLFGYGLVFWGQYLLFGYRQDVRMLASQRASFEDRTGIEAAFAPKKLELGNAEVFESAPGKYDFVTRVANPNRRHIARFTYQYIFEGGVTGTKEDTLLPGQERPVGFFGYSGASVPSSAQIVILQTVWQRINPHVIPDPEQYMEARLNFPVKNVQFIRGGEGVGDAHQISFDVTNATAYSYWQPVFYIDFVQEETVTGVAYLPLDQFRAGETRHIDLRSLAPGLFATNVRLSSVVNVFDRGAFMSPGQ